MTAIAANYALFRSRLRLRLDRKLGRGISLRIQRTLGPSIDKGEQQRLTKGAFGYRELAAFDEKQSFNPELIQFPERMPVTGGKILWVFANTMMSSQVIQGLLSMMDQRQEPIWILPDTVSSESIPLLKDSDLKDIEWIQPVALFRAGLMSYRLIAPPKLAIKSENIHYKRVMDQFATDMLHENPAQFDWFRVKEVRQDTKGVE